MRKREGEIQPVLWRSLLPKLWYACVNIKFDKRNSRRQKACDSAKDAEFDHMTLVHVLNMSFEILTIV